METVVSLFEDMEIPGNITFNANNDTTVSIDYIHFSAQENTADGLESDLFDLSIPDSVAVYEWN
jgi:hypothetical protein